MPYVPYPWVNTPAVTTQIDAAALIGLESRAANYVGSAEIGTGVGGYEDFRVKQTGGGAMTVDVGLAGTLMRGFLPVDSNGGTQRYEYSGAQLQGTVTAADVTNPRIDFVTLAPPSSQNSIVPQVLVVKGTATAGATLANLNGAPALPPSRILLAVVLVPANATQILTAQIQDRRGFPFSGVTPPVFTGADIVVPEVSSALMQTVTGISQGVNDNHASAMLVWLPRRILAGRIRWKYRNGTAPTSNYQWIIYDASGRQVAATALTAFTGAGGAIVAPNVALAAAVQLEAGNYWLAFQAATMGAGASVTFVGYNGAPNGVTQAGVMSPNVFATAAANPLGTASVTIASAMTDAYALTVDTSSTLPVPACSIGA